MPDAQRPRTDEYDEYYAAYIDLVPDGPILSILESQIAETAALLTGVPEERGSYRYRPEKWSLKEVVGHVLDSERVFAYRALAFARSDPAPLPSMDQERWAAVAPVGRRLLADMVRELELLRAANLAMFSGFSGHDLSQRGRASGCEFTVRALLYVIAGHELHHRRILEKKYLG